MSNPFPRFDVPEEHSIDTYFEYVARQGFEKRRGAPGGAARRRHCSATTSPSMPSGSTRRSAIIQQMKFSGYFLIVWDFIRYAKSKGIPVGPGRGSAAGSLVGYSMGITDIDPLQYGLLFERFLNPERISMPDIDIDFCTHRRGEVIQYVTEKYGREQVAQIITFGTLGARAAIKDVGRVLDMTFADVDAITKLIPNQLNIKLRRGHRAGAGAGRSWPNRTTASATCSSIAQTPGRHVPQRLRPRRRRRHRARSRSTNLVPLYKTNKDEIVTQYDMVGLEKLGLLKMDFLGLTTLTIIHDCIALIEKHRGETIVLDDLPLDDTKTYRRSSAQGLSLAASSSLSPTACATSCAATSRTASRTSAR